MAKRSKAEKEILDLIQRYEIVLAIASKVRMPQVDEFVAITSQSLTQLRGLLSTSPRPVPLAKLKNGLYQGLREAPLLLQRLLKDDARSDREELLRRINAAASGTSGFLAQQAGKARNIMGTGVIRNDEEWYLLRWRLDQIEGDTAHQDEAGVLADLLDAYAAGFVKPVMGIEKPIRRVAAAGDGSRGAAASRSYVPAATAQRLAAAVG